jgi:hypothetical protein
MLEAALFLRNFASLLWFLYLVFHFMLDPDPNSVPEPECITVPLRQKVAVPAIPVPQHWSTFAKNNPHREIENISRGGIVTIRTERSMQDVMVARLQSTRVQTPPSIQCNVLRESLSVDSQNIPCATLKRRGSWVISVYPWIPIILLTRTGRLCLTGGIRTVAKTLPYKLSQAPPVREWDEL